MTHPQIIRPGIDFDAFEAHLQAVYVTEQQRRCSELQDQAAESGLPLPMSPEAILTFEDAGAVVDLVTGWITWPNGIKVWNGNLVGVEAVTSEA